MIEEHNSFQVPYTDSDEDIEMPNAEPTRVVKKRKITTKPKIFVKKKTGLLNL